MRRGIDVAVARTFPLQAVETRWLCLVTLDVSLSLILLVEISHAGDLTNVNLSDIKQGTHLPWKQLAIIQ